MSNKIYPSEANMDEVLTRRRLAIHNYYINGRMYRPANFTVETEPNIETITENKVNNFCKDIFQCLICKDIFKGLNRSTVNSYKFTIKKTKSSDFFKWLFPN